MSEASAASKVPESLRGLARWISAPSTFGGLAGATVASFYAVIAVEQPPGTTGWFLGIIFVVAMVATVRGDRQEQDALRTIRALSAGQLGPSPQNLRLAVKEAFAFPDRAFWVNFQNWTGGTIAIGLLFRLLPGVQWSMSLRLCLLGVALAPVTSALTHLLVLSRSRAAVERVAEAGLSASEVIETAPPLRKQLRARLMVFAAITVLTPSVLVADLILTRASRAVQKVLEQPAGAALTSDIDPTGDLSPIVALGTVVVLLVLFAGFMGGGALSVPMAAIAEEANRITAGDLRTVKVIPCEDEAWAAAAAFTGMHAQLTGALSRLQRAGEQLASTTGDMVAGSTEHQRGAAEQASALAQTSATTEELAYSARQIASNAASVSQMADQTLRAAEAGKRGADEFFTSMGRMRSGNHAIADAIVKLNKRVQQIGKIVEFINGIADKADLLAVNAELEGTKAGEVGRGFSLVAAEMRRLAESVMHSTEEIGRLIEEIRDATNGAVMATEAGLKATEAGGSVAQRLSEALEAIRDLAAQTTEAVRSISGGTHQQQTGTGQLAESMGEILRATQAGAAASREIASANADLSTLSHELKKVVERFRVS